VTKEKRLQKLEEETGTTSENEEGLITITSVSLTFNEGSGERNVTKKETYTPEEFKRKFPGWNRERQSIYIDWTAMTDEEVQEVRRKQQEGRSE